MKIAIIGGNSLVNNELAQRYLLSSFIGEYYSEEKIIHYFRKKDLTRGLETFANGLQITTIFNKNFDNVFIKSNFEKIVEEYDGVYVFCDKISRKNLKTLKCYEKEINLRNLEYSEIGRNRSKIYFRKVGYQSRIRCMLNIGIDRSRNLFGSSMRTIGKNINYVINSIFNMNRIMLFIGITTYFLLFPLLFEFPLNFLSFNNIDLKLFSIPLGVVFSIIGVLLALIAFMASNMAIKHHVLFEVYMKKTGLNFIIIFLMNLIVVSLVIPIIEAKSFISNSSFAFYLSDLKIFLFWQFIAIIILVVSMMLRIIKCMDYDSLLHAISENVIKESKKMINAENFTSRVFSKYFYSLRDIVLESIRQKNLSVFEVSSKFYAECVTSIIEYINTESKNQLAHSYLSDHIGATKAITEQILYEKNTRFIDLFELFFLTHIDRVCFTNRDVGTLNLLFLNKVSLLKYDIYGKYSSKNVPDNIFEHMIFCFLWGIVDAIYSIKKSDLKIVVVNLNYYLNLSLNIINFNSENSIMKVVKFFKHIKEYYAGKIYNPEEKINPIITDQLNFVGISILLYCYYKYETRGLNNENFLNSLHENFCKGLSTEDIVKVIDYLINKYDPSVITSYVNDIKIMDWALIGVCYLIQKNVELQDGVFKIVSKDLILLELFRNCFQKNDRVATLLGTTISDLNSKSKKCRKNVEELLSKKQTFQAYEHEE